MPIFHSGICWTAAGRPGTITSSFDKDGAIYADHTPSDGLSTWPLVRAFACPFPAPIFIAMTLTQLRYLVAIADSGLNITLAAERVHATQPGLSKQLKQLEEELGFTLFTRRGKSLEAITAAGAQVIERARIIQSEAANIRALAANLRNEAQGELRIATTHTQARYALPPAIAALRKRYP